MIALHRFSRQKVRAFTSQEGLNRAAEAAGRACCAPLELEIWQEQTKRQAPSVALVLFIIAISLSCSLSLIGWFLA